MKKYFIGMLAVVLTAGIVAFASPSTTEKPTTLYWYEFIDIPGNDPNDPADYQRTAGSGSVEPECGVGSKRCAVLAEPLSAQNLNHPNLEAVEEIKTKQ